MRDDTQLTAETSVMDNADGSEDQGASGRGGFSVKRLWPLAVIAAGIAAFFGLGLDQYVSFEALREHRGTLLQYVADNRVAAPLIYMAIYAAAIALSLPGGAVLTIAGGFLFGKALGTTAVVVAATLGATILFVIAKSALGDPLRARAGPWLDKMAKGFQDGALSYLLVLRLIPVFPFFVVNLVPAFLGVKLWVYVVATFVGIIPGTFVFVTVGSGLGSIFDSGEDFTASGILTPDIITALVGLAILALLPVIHKKIKQRRAS